MKISPLQLLTTWVHGPRGLHRAEEGAFDASAWQRCDVTPSDLSHDSRLDFGGWAATLAALPILGRMSWPLLAMRNPLMKTPVSLLPALDRPALSLPPAQSRSIARPNC
jgi:hypothetical protein